MSSNEDILSLKCKECQPYSNRFGIFKKRYIIKYYKIPEHKIIVTYNGVSKDFHLINEKENAKDILKKYGIEGDAEQNVLLNKDERKVTVLGEITTPGTISIGVRLGILEAIAKA